MSTGRTRSVYPPPPPFYTLFDGNQPIKFNTPDYRGHPAPPKAPTEPFVKFGQIQSVYLIERNSEMNGDGSRLYFLFIKSENGDNAVD